jgi:hypothetical protein
MRPLVLLLTLSALIAGCDDTTDSGESSPTSEFAAAGKAVDPASLTPAPPPPTEAECKADGTWIICHTTLVIETVNAPAFDVGCGTIYETSRDLRLGIRWYNAADSVIVKRHVTQDFEGTWSLSPDGTGPVVTVTSHANWDDSQYADPNDLDSGIRFTHGNDVAVQAPGAGTIAHIAGLDTPDTHHGVARFIDDPGLAARLCSALTP